MHILLTNYVYLIQLIHYFGNYFDAFQLLCKSVICCIIMCISNSIMKGNMSAFNSIQSNWHLVITASNICDFLNLILLLRS